MARNPDHDIAAQKLEVSLRESNVAMADDQFETADRALELGMRMLQALQPDKAVTLQQRIALAHAHIQGAATIYAQVDAKMALEVERAQVAHMRAHLEHSEADQQRAAQVARIRDDGLQSMRQALIDAGFDPQAMPFGFVIPPTEDDDRPNT